MTYLGPPGGPRDPATPGGYCLARCYCGGCPQFRKQEADTALLREMERQKDRRPRRRRREAA